MWQGREAGLVFLVIVGLVLIDFASDADACRSGCLVGVGRETWHQHIRPEDALRQWDR
jgi:hypothetical protein